MNSVDILVTKVANGSFFFFLFRKPYKDFPLFGYCVITTHVQIPVSIQFYKKYNLMLGLTIAGDPALKHYYLFTDNSIPFRMPSLQERLGSLSHPYNLPLQALSSLFERKASLSGEYCLARVDGRSQKWLGWENTY